LPPKFFSFVLSAITFNSFFVIQKVTIYYKSMPRPTQRRDGVVRSIRQPVAFSLIEYGQLKRSAYENNMSVSELIRWRCLTRKVERPKEPPLLDEQLYFDLNSLGIELNQVTHKVNAAVNIDIDPGIYIDKVQQLNSKLDSLLNQIRQQLETASSSRLPIESKQVDKSPSERKLSVRLAPDEYSTIKNKARLAKTSIPQFLRKAALRQKVTQPPPPPVINWKLYKELGSINVNMKQLAKKLPTITDELLADWASQTNSNPPGWRTRTIGG
jgi:hypothetical protein